MRKFKPVPAAAAMAAALSLVTGCAVQPLSDESYDLVSTRVEPIEYARILCRDVDMEDRHTCMTIVMQNVRAERQERDYVEPKSPLSGPFVVLFEEDLYQGRYVSQPFAAAFTVTNGSDICRGRYDALAGDTKAIFDVRCDNGRRGSANIILDQGGRDGIGILHLDDGRTGDIVFGHAAVGSAYL